MKADGGMEAKELQYMVMEINRQEVRPEEVLSDQVYRYGRESQSISLAATREETEELLRGYFPLEIPSILADNQGIRPYAAHPATPLSIPPGFLLPQTGRAAMPQGKKPRNC